MIFQTVALLSVTPRSLVNVEPHQFSETGMVEASFFGSSQKVGDLEIYKRFLPILVWILSQLTWYARVFQLVSEFLTDGKKCVFISHKYFN